MAGHDHQAALQIPCDGCGALPGCRCRTWGIEAVVPHEERLTAIREVQPVRLVTWLDLFEEQVA